MSENPSTGHDESTTPEPGAQQHPTTELPQTTEPTQALPSHPVPPAAEARYPEPQYSEPQYSEPQYGVRLPQEEPYGQTPAQPQYGAPAYGAQQPPQPGYAPGSGTPDSAQTPSSSQPFYGQQSGYGQHGVPQHAYQPAQPKTARKVGVGTLIAAVLAAGLVGGGVAAGIGAATSGQQTATSQPATSGQGIVINNKDSVTAVTAAAAKAAPSVVTIAATGGNSSGTGSGIVLDDQGHILTNTHVVTLDGATASATIQVRTSDGTVLNATVVGIDPLSDLAVIKVDPKGLTPATLGDSSKLNVGDTAIAIGAPLGLSNTVTDGIVSTTNRTISVQSSAVPSNGSDGSSQNGNGNGYNFAPPNGGQSNNSGSGGSVYLNVIQTDAAINPGNSGGALVNGQGEVIGVNVAIATAGSGSSGDSSSSGNIGVGFSIPINYAKRIANDIIQNGKATHGQLGTTVQSAPAGSGSASAFSDGGQVVNVTSGSAADKAGIKKGDIITNFAGFAVSDSQELTAAVREQPAGSTVTVKLLRNGKSMDVQVTLGAAQS
ncbi:MULTISPECIES: trypsin-like peptidase domain-containing protein [Arthrobacter]|uniref:Trypsin-like peptidase domain-containing protein n=2 Tax=Arthrobacter TaxID=1663 RepID=A0ABU9KJS1_9MICC|nr:trypsin-like peptidase domain-containing protein [Arthrobacter sp. YJM1]MDP5227199.1 trypsin-like peptidase domain-containing protein [Arthrobacter sp. YJM1]